MSCGFVVRGGWGLVVNPTDLACFLVYPAPPRSDQCRVSGTSMFLDAFAATTSPTVAAPLED